MINLISSIYALEQKKQKVLEQCRDDIAEIDKAIEVLKKANEACPDCGGKGWTFQGPCDDCADPDGKVRCPSCKGTGYRVYTNKEGVLLSAKYRNELLG